MTDMLGYYFLELQGVTTTENDASIIEFLKGVPFRLALLTTAFLPAVVEEVILRGYFFKKLFGSKQLLESLFQACFSEPFMDRPILPLG
ncbi:hypothetical protein [Streptococcus suis]|uniref:hypothetical protein n=1 Tax=Streptococcus suis TaxID=1307 RepID=UPI0021BC184B|nr:hypothetical protein [Streptococcus suis]